MLHIKFDLDWLTGLRWCERRRTTDDGPSLSYKSTSRTFGSDELKTDITRQTVGKSTGSKLCA